MCPLLFVTVSVIILYPVDSIWPSIIPPPPKLDYHEWWGPEENTTQDTSIRPFRVHFNESMIKDLRTRLTHHRPFTPPLEGIGFQYGFNTDTLESWVQYWAQDYPFAERENYINKYPQFKTNIQGLDIHFVWVKPEVCGNKKVVPLLLLHGWPSSILEFYRAVPFLTTLSDGRDFVLELIIPSLPGFGYSDSAVRPGLGPVEIGVVLRNFMHRLGHQQFYIQGGDAGSIIGSIMATIFPKEVLGYHTNFGIVLDPKALILIAGMAVNPYLFMDPKLVHRLYPLTKTIEFLLEESGYFLIQATKPDTVGVGLTDSPSGLLAYILEKYSTSTNKEYRQLKDGGLTRKYTRDELIDILMIYWTSNCITTSMRLYAETTSKKELAFRTYETPTTVPTWVIQAEHELIYEPPNALRVKYHNLVNVTAIPYGGHFLALELPQVFSEDVLDAIKTFRGSRTAKIKL
ncbi:juvenile hormone epoxide hydrolase-like [Galleria mellonella]|uniref:Epoxide hydrolase n=1 Tax=Galleria mellonella TaxID=7137 RepID=A0ABM3N3B9_GALME|nr:juvenile hormone epoxide hydrolase-like [Galleria mellonella]